MAATADIENKLIKNGYEFIAGVDESGCGSLAGKVVVAAVIFPPGLDFAGKLPGLNDSKKKSQAQRDVLYELVKEHALTYCVATASVGEIDLHNIYWAKFIAARRALDGLSVDPDYVLMDGGAEIPEIDMPQEAIVKGDGKSVSIAAASILAKVERDSYMVELADKVHEDYGWHANKAYWCKEHVEALEKHGKTKWHRAKFIRKINVGGSR